MISEALALGLVLDEDRGSLPFALIHGEPLVTVATFALEAADIDLVDHLVSWATLAETGETVVLHDPLCPMTPPTFIADCVQQSLLTGAVVVGVRPVTDTIRGMDRDELVQVCSPLVLPPAVVAELDRVPASSFADTVALLARRHPVVKVEAPPEARRIASVEDVRLLEAQTRRASS